ncbi:pyruvate formate-lyase 1-activating enzyme [Clostridium acetireducens DSM 10703]|jgi:pyruvate formate lyase activating enzyme|uniref:Pyruvate formate-lyase-activating enzyme n=1 Tax=Clostridium acetireducens DSM 10703 TaxID=1121290 RepID=A0A1E8EUW8_9CLOT|nr:pyruvate formate-lyase-activating protein [Clostridium acetireducens]OFH98017.1 pyruvate formate-lyase 1-activating enzyme [Clostridium acetireducens DSM 10703]
MIKGRIHSFESMGLVDGPGIRNVVFLQGCKLRCLFCHNPDTWNIKGGEEISSEDLINKILRFKPYFKNKGGVTFSGGEPLMQPEFLLEMLKLCKLNGIHTAIDTAGYGKGNYCEILKYTDLVILDVKNVDNDGYIKITGCSKYQFDEFLDTVQKLGNKLWIRHVVVPGYTDSIKHIEKLAEIIKKLKNVEKIELLPYHTLGKYKYDKLKIKYKLENTESMNKEKTKELENMLISLCKK